MVGDCRKSSVSGAIADHRLDDDERSRSHDDGDDVGHPLAKRDSFGRDSLALAASERTPRMAQIEENLLICRLDVGRPLFLGLHDGRTLQAVAYFHAATSGSRGGSAAFIIRRCRLVTDIRCHYRFSKVIRF
jgi:hypothetical protein